jgi:hypothetical protein
MSNITTVSQAEIKEARHRLWHAGILTWKLDPTQLSLYDFYNSNKSKTIVVNASRRLGKSFFLVILALEQCIKNPKSIIVYIQPETAMIRKNLNPDIETMLEDCPLELRPKFGSQDNTWTFPNGSKILLAGTDGQNYDKLRGGKAHLCLVDEAGYCSDLKKIITSILLPLTLNTRGRVILSSTTSTDPDHEFNAYVDTAEVKGDLIRKTILDAVEDHKKSAFPRITEEIVAEIISSYPKGMNDQQFRTEFLCEKVFNSSDAVLPEFSQDVQTDCVVEWPRPQFFDRYVAMDIGFKDLTVVLFAYWDFNNNVLVIEDEYVGNGPEITTSILAAFIKKKEADLWKNQSTGEVPEIHKRVSDNNLIVINDLSVDHKLHFLATEKHDKLSWMSELRRMIEARQIIINPRCKTLVSHMRSASWDKHRKDFKRHVSGHHYDAVAALLYLSRNIDKTRSPYPAGYRYAQLGKSSEVFVNPYNQKEEFSNPEYKKIKDMFTRKSTFNRRVAK